MKTMFAILALLSTSAVSAHESLGPHRHPHATSYLPGVELIGVAALVLSLAVIVVVHFKRR